MPFKETSRMEEQSKCFWSSRAGTGAYRSCAGGTGSVATRFTNGASASRAVIRSGSEDGSHAPLQCWQTTDQAIATKVIAARRRFPYLGPRKLLAVLDRETPEIAWPAASTIGTILKRAGLVAVGKAAPPPARPAAALHASDGAQRRMERRLQGLVSHPRPATDRSADGGGQFQPFPDRAAGLPNRQSRASALALSGLFASTACRLGSAATTARRLARAAPAA